MRGSARTPRARAAALALALLPVPLAAQAPGDGSGPGPPPDATAAVARDALPLLLDVPFVAQEPLLCGAAAVEMALRHEGVRELYARDFRPLVREEEGGIRTDELAAAVRALGWESRAGPSDAAALRRHLADGRPVVLLLEEARARYHYVLLVGWEGDAVRIHDPARRPAMRLPLEDFLARWDGAGRWAMAIAGRTAGARGAGPGGRPEARSGLGVRVTSAPAYGSLVHATPAPGASEVIALPRHPALVEATRHFRASRWEAAARAAGEAVGEDPRDAEAWHLLATSRYLAGDRSGALAAWNRAGSPRLDAVRVSGLRRTRHPAVHRLLSLPPGGVLTAAEVERARRRLALLPAAQATSLDYRALPGGLAEVEAAVLERPLLPAGRLAVATLLLPALVESEVRATVSSPLGGGEAATFFARWAEARPAVGGSVTAPGFLGAPGIARLAVAWERERHLVVAGEDPLVEERAGVRLELADWATPRLAWRAGAGLDRWADGARSAVLGVGAGVGGAEDRLSVTVDAEAGAGVGVGAAPSWLGWTVRGQAAPLDQGVWRIDLRLLASGVGAGAPRILRPGAGVGRAREGLLRAHRLDSGEALDAALLGTTLLNATAEASRRLLELPLARLDAAAFMDAGRVARPGGHVTRLVDGGVGLRLRLPSGTLRADAARGSDGRRALSLAWEARDAFPFRGSGR